VSTALFAWERDPLTLVPEADGRDLTRQSTCGVSLIPLTRIKRIRFRLHVPLNTALSQRGMLDGSPSLHVTARYRLIILVGSVQRNRESFHKDWPAVHLQIHNQYFSLFKKEFVFAFRVSTLAIYLIKKLHVLFIYNHI
jgi:hypothetical protein